MASILGSATGRVVFSPTFRKRKERKRSDRLRTSCWNFPSSKEMKETYQKVKSPSMDLLQGLRKIMDGTKTVKKTSRADITKIQIAGGALLSGVLLKTLPVNEIAGLLLIGLCVSVTLSGYIYSLNILRGQPRSSSKAVMYLEAHELSKEVYSFCANQLGTFRMTTFLVSPFYEPSFIYMLFNCWGLYAVGQLKVCQIFGGGILFGVCGASFLLGRLVQMFCAQFWKTESEHIAKPEIPSTLEERFVDWLILPTGTWGIGPILNALIWMCYFAIPSQWYLATPTGIHAPLWTASGIPILLLIEDMYSLINRDRRAQKIQNSSTPGLQVASFVVGLCAAIIFR